MAIFELALFFILKLVSTLLVLFRRHLEIFNARRAWKLVGCHLNRSSAAHKPHHVPRPKFLFLALADAPIIESTGPIDENAGSKPCQRADFHLSAAGAVPCIAVHMGVVVHGFALLTGFLQPSLLVVPIVAVQYVVPVVVRVNHRAHVVKPQARALGHVFRNRRFLAVLLQRVGHDGTAIAEAAAIFARCLEHVVGRGTALLLPALVVGVFECAVLLQAGCRAPQRGVGRAAAGRRRANDVAVEAKVNVLLVFHEEGEGARLHVVGRRESEPAQLDVWHQSRVHFPRNGAAAELPPHAHVPHTVNFKPDRRNEECILGRARFVGVGRGFVRERDVSRVGQHAGDLLVRAAPLQRFALRDPGVAPHDTFHHGFLGCLAGVPLQHV